METIEHQQPRSASDSLILGVVAAYAAVFVMFGFLVQPPADVLRGLGAILTTRDALLTDYFGVGGIGAGCVSAGLLTLAGALVYGRAGAKMTGASVAALFLVLGFGLFGKNLLNVRPIVAGVALYARFRCEPFRAHLNTAFSAALAPIFSEILFSTDLMPMVGVPLALATGLAAGFILPPAGAHLSRAHMGFSLYNMGFTGGVVGTIVVAMYKAFGYVPDPVFIWTKGANSVLSVFLGLVFASMVVVGWAFDRTALERLGIILRTSGRSPTDFIATRSPPERKRR